MSASSLELARRVADAVLFEGYLLYPYRGSAPKNRARWQFGVLAPRADADATAETWFSQTDVLVEPGPDTVVRVAVRFLQLQGRAVEVATDEGRFRPVDSLLVGEHELISWDEGVERGATSSFVLADLLRAERAQSFDVTGGEDVEPVDSGDDGRPDARIVRRRWPACGVVRASAELLDGPFGVVRLRVRIENVTETDEAAQSRELALRRSFVAAHALLSLDGGHFVSLLEPPEWARGAVASCENAHTYPVLVGEGDRRDVVLSSPIILYDHPEIAPESPGELFDGTEIDEILTLRTMALTDDEKREARATDARAAALLDRVDSLPPELLERLHGAIRSVGPSASPRPAREQAGTSATPWWDPGADASVSPETDRVWVGAVALSRGSRVRLRPGPHRADAQDMFLDGRIATVEAVLADVDDHRHLAVTLDDDPASELLQWHGRFLYFSPDEVEPLEVEPLETDGLEAGR